MACNANIPHSEMWDDSALVSSWNDALQEYKKYHSIEAKGENASEILKATENDLDETMACDDKQVENADLDDPYAKKNCVQASVDHNIIPVEQHGQLKNKSLPTKQATEGPPALPQHLIGQVHDESLKNLLMSWYYAGYYTGLYEGQQGAAGKSKDDRQA